MTRALAPAREALPAFRGGSSAPRVQRAPLRVSSPEDASEREATAAARSVMSMSPAVVSPVGPSVIQRSARPAAQAAVVPGAPASGQPLPATLRRFMEPRFGADFAAVRIHTDAQAGAASRRLGARAFAIGQNVFFGAGQFQPDTAAGQELIAHELAHTVQQGAAPRVPVQRSADLTLTPEPPGRVQRLGISDALDYFADKANLIPGFRMFTVVLGVNPINMSRVDRSAANILRAVVELMPGGALITQALDNHGVFERVGSWVEQQIATLGLTGAMIRNAVTRFIDSLGWRDIFDLGGVWDRAKRIFTEPIDRIRNFVVSLVGRVIEFIKDAILRPLERLAEGTRGWDLLCAVLGRNPITGDTVPRNAQTLIGGFMKLIGQEEIWNNIQRGNAVGRAWSWFQGTLSGLLGFVQELPQLFLGALRSLSIADIVLVPRAFARVASVFGGFALRFVSWAGEQVWGLLQIIFEVVAPQVMVYIRRAGSALRTIIRDPVRFIGNLVRAGMQGLRQFAGNFLTHLRASLIGWLTGAMSGANIYIPQGFTLREILKFVLSVLGLTWQNIRQKLVRAIGETAVAALETGFDIVLTLVREGPAAAWEKIVESINNLREMVIEQVMAFVRNSIVTAAITRLVSMLNPAGAFIQAIIAIYNTVMFFVERMRQIAQVAAAVIDSIDAIARGVITAAANRVEQTMAGLLTLVISFLARIAGLGRVTDAVTNVINRVRVPIDRALDRVVNWLVEQARRLGRVVAQAGVPQDPAQRLVMAGRHAVTLARALGRRVARPLLDPMLRLLTTRYSLRRIEAIERGGTWWVRMSINPDREENLNVPSGSTAAAGAAGSPGAPAAGPDPARLRVGQVIEIRQSRGVADTRTRDPYIWFVATITNVDQARQRVSYQSANRRRVNTGVLLYAEFDAKWVFGHNSQVRISAERIAEANADQRWDDRQLARAVLNYRHHNDQAGVPGKEWEHVIEVAVGGEHSSQNLALTTSTINNRLGQLFRYAYSSREAPRGLPGTGDMPLRSYLLGQNSTVRTQWKEHFYATEFRVTLQWKRSERGIWRELA